MKGVFSSTLELICHTQATLGKSTLCAALIKEESAFELNTDLSSEEAVSVSFGGHDTILLGGQRPPEPVCLTDWCLPHMVDWVRGEGERREQRFASHN